MDYIEKLFEQYGYLVLLIGLLLDFVALPFPGQTTITYAGYLSFKGILHWWLGVLSAYLGSTIGLTITYMIGLKVGRPVVLRYGKWVFLNARNMNRTKRWFDKYGMMLLLIVCFIPGVRQFIGYFSGIIKMSFRQFSLFTYTGAAIWVICFFAIGKLLGPQWQSLFNLAREYSFEFGILVMFTLTLYVFLRIRERKRLRQRILKRRKQRLDIRRPE